MRLSVELWPESEEADKKKEEYFQLSGDLRTACSDLCDQLMSDEVKEFGDFLIPFDFYFRVDENLLTEIMNFADKNQLFELRSKALRFRNMFLKNLGANDEKVQQ